MSRRRKRKIKPIEMVARLNEKYEADHVEISLHAIRQFAVRWQLMKKGEELTNPRVTLEKFLLKSVVEPVPPARRLIRILANKCVRAEYYRFERWQFIVVEDGPKRKIVVTAALVNY